ncbi:hypothetical protein GZL_09060 [Streptomyces sp. 769]|nr:hypothetical protein GZL_09060 [Streptomyces sp. 769]
MRKAVGTGPPRWHGTGHVEPRFHRCSSLLSHNKVVVSAANSGAHSSVDRGSTGG